MELHITINDDRYNELLQKELEAFDKKEIANIIALSLKEYFSNKEVIERYLIKKDYYSSDKYVASDIVKSVLNDVDLTDVKNEIKNAIIASITKDNSIVKDVISAYIYNLFSSGMMLNIQNGEIGNIIKYIIDQRVQELMTK